MQIGVEAASATLGVSPRRVRAMIAAGGLPARSVSGRWVLDESDLVGMGARRPVRPMSPRIAGALLDLISEVDVQGLAPSELWRLRRRLVRLSGDPAPAALLRAWTRARTRPCRFAVAPADLVDLAADPRVALSGISDERSGIVAVGEVEAWIARPHLREVCEEHLLVESGTPNVTFRIADRTPDPVPLGWSVADLAGHRGAREEAQVARLLQRFRASG